MFLLPNNKVIDLDGLLDAISDTDSACRYFLDADSGEIGCVDVNDAKKLVAVSAGNRYFETPRIPERTQREWVEEFAEFIGSVDEGGLSLRQKLLLALENAEDLDVCIQIIEDDASEWVHGWDQWYDDHLSKEAEIWLSELPIEIMDDWDLDDDCELCGRMKDGERTEGDFLEALAKEKRKGNVVANFGFDTPPTPPGETAQKEITAKIESGETTKKNKRH